METNDCYDITERRARDEGEEAAGLATEAGKRVC